MTRINTSRNIHLSSLSPYLASVADVSSSYLSLSAKRSMNLVDNVGSQFQIRPHSKQQLHSYGIGILQPLDFSYTSTSYCCYNLPAHRLLISLNPDYSRVTLISHRRLQVSTNESGPKPFPSPCISMFSHIPSFVRPYAA